jgi:hypothetical protein
MTKTQSFNESDAGISVPENLSPVKENPWLKILHNADLAKY